MKRFGTKDFRSKNHFVLYSDSDNEILFLDNFEELSRYINYTIRDLIKTFNRYAIDDTINIIIDKKKYQLYTFVD